MGSSSLITKFDGEVTQHVEYIPYGEVFIEERNNTWNTPYLFNAKELDEETGLYYYGARYLNPMDGMWLSVDPMFEKYVGMNPYNYCAGNPVKLVDPDGRNPVYSSSGDYRGNTEEDFTGSVIIYDGNLNFSSMSSCSLLYDNFDISTQRGDGNKYDIVRGEISGEAKSKI